MALKEEIKSFFKGEMNDDETSLNTYSHDASIFEVKPKLVLFPKDSEDVQRLVSYVSEHKADDPKLSITARSAGSCMSGGSLNESIIVDFTKHINGIKALNASEATVLPGTYYRDFEPETLKLNAILPCFTASKNICALGGMIANNAAGEKTLQYGKMEDYINELKVVFADGKEYVVKPLTRTELASKIAQNDYEGNLYKKTAELIEKNKEIIMAAKPDVSKNSAGYYLWNVWQKGQGNGEAGGSGEEVFNLNRLLVGSQGTLGIVTEAKLKLVPVKKMSKLFVIFMRDLTKLGDLVNEILEFKPETVESYDDSTMKLAMRFLPDMFKTMKKTSFFKLIFSFIPEVLMMLSGGIPKLIVLVEFSGDDEKVIDEQMIALQKRIAHFKFTNRMTRSEAESEKYWTIRRESFNLLRKHIHGSRTVPFIDDVVVKPRYLPEFLPRMRKILDDYKLVYTIAGHAGNGNFHIIPLMDMKKAKSRSVIKEISDKVYDLVLEFHGSTTGEHNDGIIRTPYLRKMYGEKVYSLFEETKKIFDPQNIFNPGKKVGGTIEYMESHIAVS